MTQGIVGTSNGSNVETPPAAAPVQPRVLTPQEVMQYVLGKIYGGPDADGNIVEGLDTTFEPGEEIADYQDAFGGKWVAPVERDGKLVTARAASPGDVGLDVLTMFKTDEGVRIYCIPNVVGITFTRFLLSGREKITTHMGFDDFCTAVALDMIEAAGGDDEEDEEEDEEPTIDDAREALRGWADDLKALRASSSASASPNERMVLGQAIERAAAGLRLAVDLYTDLADEEINEDIPDLEKELARLNKRVADIHAKIAAFRAEDAAAANMARPVPVASTSSAQPATSTIPAAPPTATGLEVE